MPPARLTPSAQLELLEPVSPELALVDPELAEVARGALPEVCEWRPQIHPATPPLPNSSRERVRLAGPPSRVREHSLRRYLQTPTWATTAPMLLFLLVGAVVVAMVTSEVRAAFLGPVASVVPGPASTFPAGTTTEDVERRTVTLLAAGTTVLPALLGDRQDLLADDLRISCRQIGGTARFTCRVAVRPFSSRDWLLTVVVRSDGTESLLWHGRVPRG